MRAPSLPSSVAIEADAVRFLHAQLRGVGDPRASLRHAGRHREHGHLVDEARDHRAAHERAAESRAARREVGDGLARRQGGAAPAYRRAHRLERVEKPRARLVDTHARDRDLRPLRDRARHEQEGRGGDVPRDGDALPAKLAPGVSVTVVPSTDSRRPEARQHALSVVARAHGSVTVTGPSAQRPASSSAVLTWAEATGES